MIKSGVERKSLQWLVAISLLIALPHAFNLSFSLIIFFILLSGWRYLGIEHPEWLPDRWLLFCFTIIGLILTLSEAEGLPGLSIGVSLLTILFALKLLELRTNEELYSVIFLCFFTTITHFLFDQSLLIAGYLLLTTILLVTVLVSLNRENCPFQISLKMAGRLTTQAVPVMIVLFLFFPRISTPLWSLPNDSHAVSGGLSPVMEPGSISRLSLSKEIAFRAKFEQGLPPPDQRYWRGQVFWKTDGKRWQLSKLKSVQSEIQPYFSSNHYRYTIMLEPHQQKRLFVLDLPIQSTHQGLINGDYLAISNNKIIKTTQYTAVSAPAYNTGILSRQERTLGLQLPDEKSEKTIALVNQWKMNGYNPDHLIEQALQFFRDEPFSYTLNPPQLLGRHPVEAFLFESRRGFCEHYATAFVYLMRIAGIPSRIVAGYQGGQYNPVGQFLEIRQADAHAWAEVWLENRGWVRIDPTAAVAPERVELGVDLENQLFSREVRFAFSPPTGLVRLGLNIRHILSNIDYNWQIWVLGYSFEKQLSFLSTLGISSLRSNLMWMIVASLSFFSLIAYWLLRKRFINKDKPTRLYHRYCKKLSTKGLPRRPSEGATAFSLRAIGVFPELEQEIHLITDTYQRLRYEKESDPDDLLFLQQMVRRFQP